MPASFDFIDEIFAWVDPRGPGCAVGVYRDGEAVVTRGFGQANLEQGVAITASTVFHIASISKHVTALCAGLLSEDGTLDLDDRLDAYLPQLRIGGDITLRQILHHTSGLRDQWGLLDLAGWRHEDLKTTEDILQLAARQRGLNFPAGSRFQYINTGYTLLGVIIERITGKSLRAFAEERVFAPLKMRRSHFHDDCHEIIPDRADAYSRDDRGVLKINVPAYATAGPTGLFSTVEDFASWERNLLFPDICSRELVKAMQTPGNRSDGQSTAYGYGLALGIYRGLETAEHAGGDAGFRSHFLRFPDQRFAVAIFCNTPISPPGQLARRIADHVLAPHFEDASAAPSGTAAHASRAVGVTVPSGDALLAYCGRYREPGGNDLADISYRDGRLFLSSPDGADYELLALGVDEFAFAGLDATCRFEIEAGRVHRFRTFYGGTETAALEAIENDLPSDVAVSPGDYVGHYFSEELDISYRVEAEGSGLLLSRGKKGCHGLLAISRDQFCCPGGLSIRFCRDEDSQVEAMAVSTERVWNVHFVRRGSPGNP